MVLKAAPKLPRLRMKDELLKAAPELAKLMGEEMPEPAGDASLVGAAGTQAGGHALDNLLGFEDELTEEDELRMELEVVKRERARFMASLAQVKADSGRAGGELQAEDVRRLRKELELKLQKLNELKRESRRFDHQIARLSLTSRDCVALMPGEQPAEQARIEHLQQEHKVLEEELVEAEAKNRLYTLLGERTRREHMAMEKQVRMAREEQEAYLEDAAVLTAHMHDMRAAREDAERELAHARRTTDDARKDWARKLKDRRREVHDLERRQHREAERDSRRATRAAERERAEKERAARVAAEEQAYEAQLQALQPKLEAMEASWYRLHSISGADTPEAVIAYWEGLRTKEENMRELVRLAEVREADARKDMARLLGSRSEMFEAQNAAAGSGTPDYASMERDIEEADRRKTAARTRFNKLRSVCIAAQQGLRSVVARLESALQDAAAQRAAGLLRTGSRRLSKGGSRGSSRNERRPLGGPGGASMKESRRGYEANLSAERGVLPAEPSGTQLARLDDGIGNTIDDAEFFPDLPALLEQCADRMARLMDLDRRLIAALHKVDENTPATPDELQATQHEGELALHKGFRRRTWTGPAWIDNVTPTGHIMPAGLKMRRQKGDKRDVAPAPDLTRIQGYTGSEAEAAAPATDSDSDKEEAGATPVGPPGKLGGAEWDGVVDRDYIKHRAQKLAKQHDARAKAQSAGSSGQGSRAATASGVKA